MTSDASAYEALGLSPGADQVAIERAYKALIKRYHPDREGGDAAKASEINQAYFRLRRAINRPAHLSERTNVSEAIYARRPAQLVRRRKRRSRLWPALLLLAAVLLYFRWDSIGRFAQNGWAEFRSRTEPRLTEGRSTGGAGTRGVSLDDGLNRAAVAASVQRAIALHRAGNEEALIEQSRHCHQALRSEPSLEQLDRCAAFDNAVLELQRNDPLGDDGPFGATAIASRQISAGTLLSEDYLAIDARLDRVRGEVQTLLAPPPLPDVEASNVADGAR